MDVKEAYLKLKKLPGRNFLASCIDVGDRWAFRFFPKVVDPSKYGGGSFDSVHKETGEIGEIPICFVNFELITTGKQIDVKQFKDVNPKALSKLEKFLFKFFNK